MLALFERAFDAVRGAVLLRGVADHEERQPGNERGGGGEDDASEHGRGKPHGLRLVLADGCGDPLASGAFRPPYLTVSGRMTSATLSAANLYVALLWQSDHGAGMSYLSQQVAVSSDVEQFVFSLDVTDGRRKGVLVEYDDTDKLFTRPADKRTEETKKRLYDAGSAETRKIDAGAIADEYAENSGEGETGD